MLSRSRTVLRLIKLRKLLKEKEEKIDELDNSLDEYHSKIKKQLDDLLIDVIGIPEKDQYQVNQIIQKALTGEIKEKTAVVAIHEIFKDYIESDQDNKNSKNSSKTKTEETEDELEQLYKNGYR